MFEKILGTLMISPSRSRILYDAGVLAASSLATLFFGYWLSGSALSAFSLVAFLLSPLLGLFFNSWFGIYGRHRLAGGRQKVQILSLSVAILVTAMVALTGNFALSILLGAFAWGPLVLPRAFLALHQKRRLDESGSIERSIAHSLHERGPVLVVGGAGYIGTFVVEQLLASGYPVRVLDRLFYGKESLKEFIVDPRFEVIEGDVTDIGRLVEAVRGTSSVVHLAGLVGDPACAIDERTTAQCNIIATRMLREVTHSFGVSRFIFASSCSVYGSSDEIVDENSTLNPVSLYARTKIESEQELLQVIPDGYTLTVLRFATVFGHSRRPRFDLVANLFVAQAFHNGVITVHGGDQWRPFVHVSDLARAIVTVLKARRSVVQGQIFNVGDERLNVTVADLAHIVQKVVSEDRKVEVELHNDSPDKRNYRVSFKKIQQELGFKTAISLEEGVREIYENFKANRYGNFKDKRYSNFETTKEVVNEFQDPQQSGRLYTPLGSPSGIAKAA